jgi:hypothetical protein
MKTMQTKGQQQASKQSPSKQPSSEQSPSKHKEHPFHKWVLVNPSLSLKNYSKSIKMVAHQAILKDNNRIITFGGGKLLRYPEEIEDGEHNLSSMLYNLM